MTATIERTQEYETNNRQFCSRLSEYLLIMFKFQVSFLVAASFAGLCSCVDITVRDGTESSSRRS